MRRVFVLMLLVAVVLVGCYVATVVRVSGK
jgi:hypothetical protein